MPRSTISNRRAVHFDKSLELRNASNPAISSGTAETGVDFPVRKQMKYTAAVHTTGYTGYVATTAEWQVAIEVSATLAGTYVQVGIAPLPGAGGDVLIPLDGAYVEDILATAEFIRARSIKVGSPGNLVYGAYVSPC
ncbi:MAG: hypothetical protein KME29_04800 [Calothrix sp. FI2-JRJ7]|jgi:hypothetical protein|nr:hypothetical protein [Calothrix sp. FI2-JRJ7]